MTFYRALVLALMTDGFVSARGVQEHAVVALVSGLLWLFGRDPVAPAVKVALREFLEEQRRGR